MGEAFWEPSVDLKEIVCPFEILDPERIILHKLHGQIVKGCNIIQLKLLKPCMSAPSAKLLGNTMDSTVPSSFIVYCHDLVKVHCILPWEVVPVNNLKCRGVNRLGNEFAWICYEHRDWFILGLPPWGRELLLNLGPFRVFPGRPDQVFYLLRGFVIRRNNERVISARLRLYFSRNFFEFFSVFPVSIVLALGLVFSRTEWTMSKCGDSLKRKGIFSWTSSSRRR